MKFSTITSFLGLAAVGTALPSLENKRAAACAASDTGISAARAAQVNAAFASASLVPQSIATISPKVDLSVSYNGKAVNLGNTFTVLEVAPRPDISFSAEPGYDPATTKYLILMVDPDAPEPRQDGAPSALGFFMHQATWNASPRCVNSANNGGGEDITIPGYRSPTPLSLAAHRYVQLVYRQPPGFQRPSELALTTARFDLNGFVARNGLVNVGANFYRTGLNNVATDPGLVEIIDGVGDELLGENAPPGQT